MLACELNVSKYEESSLSRYFWKIEHLGAKPSHKTVNDE